MATKQFIDFSKFLDINNFIQNGILNDSTNHSRSNGVMRLNRFVGVLSLVNLISRFPSLGHNNDITDGGFGSDFVSWDIFKVNCPALRLGVEAKEVDMRPRYFFQNWQYDDLSISFLESADMKMRHFFFEWMQSCLTAKTYARSYYDDVMAPWFMLYPLNFQGQAERYEVFYELVPFEVNDINFDLSDNGDQLVLTTVKFKYTAHEVLSLPSHES